MQSSPLIKICGLTEPNNALDCIKAGADAIGLVFYPKSPRYLSMERAVAITKILPVETCIWGVFVNADFDSIMNIKNACNLKVVQLHGQEPPELIKRLKQEQIIIIKALFYTSSPRIEEASEYPDAYAFLIEWGGGRLPGGNAETWNYSLSKQLSFKHKIVIAGGLSPTNVAWVITKTKPWAVDVSSGVESAPGIKDMQKVRFFIENSKITLHHLTSAQ